MNKIKKIDRKALFMAICGFFIGILIGSIIGLSICSMYGLIEKSVIIVGLSTICGELMSVAVISRFRVKLHSIASGFLGGIIGGGNGAIIGILFTMSGFGGIIFGLLLSLLFSLCIIILIFFYSENDFDLAMLKLRGL